MPLFDESERRPICHATNAEDCVSGEYHRLHANYMHAESWEDVQAALDREEVVLDNDGDIVLRIDADGGGNGYIYNNSGDPDDGSSHHYPDEVGKILLPMPTVTESDLDYVWESLGVKP